ncbi:MAG TPA: aminotransferase class IV [Isosphaeraceae bacterium]|jgi:D-alanine transaminase|nr:aminotransferase class IV [Isosphaeraceae bacterium]
MESLACLDGELMPADRARVPIWDRGFLFGDAVYEVMRIYGGRCWLEDEHFARLRRSLEAVAIGGVDLERLRGRVRRTIEASGIEEGTAYLHVTRGVAPRSHAFPDPPVPPTELIVIRPYDDAPTAAQRAAGVAILGRPDLRWGRCDIKSTNLLPNVLALQDARRAGCAEAVLVDAEGFVTEATHSSLVWVRGGKVEATPEGPGILPGTSRRFVERLAAAEGLEIVPARVTLDDLQRADEVMLMATTSEVLPVVRVDSSPIADGKPGPVARRLQHAHTRAIEDWLSR